MADSPAMASGLSGALKEALAAHGAGPVPPGERSVPPAIARAPQDIGAVVALPGVLPVGWEVIEALREKVSRDLVAAEQDRPLPSEEDRLELGRSLVSQRVAEFATAHARTQEPLTAVGESAVRQAVFDALFKAGALQRYLDDPDVENIVVDGDRVEVDFHNRPSRRVPPLAESNEALLNLINQLAARSGSGERRLTPASPMAHFRLPDRSRVASTLLTSRPTMAIRRHRIISAGLEELIEWGTLNPCLSAFLQGLVLAKKSILVAGDMGVGKTSLLRALARKIPSQERVVTLESDRELFLDEDPPGGPHFLSMEARESNGERDSAGRMTGQISIADMFPTSLRMLASRVIVGEVRDAEAVPMLQAMAAGGSGSMCTLHAAVPSLVLPRLAQLCLQDGPNMTATLAHQLIANSVNFIVYLRMIDETKLVDGQGRPGRRHRFVSHVWEVGPGEDGSPELHQVFGPGEKEPRAVPHLPPQCIGDLEDVGFDARWLTVEPYGRWAAPLETVRQR